jgi:hypothetical protein
MNPCRVACTLTRSKWLRMSSFILTKPCKPTEPGLSNRWSPSRGVAAFYNGLVRRLKSSATGGIADAGLVAAAVSSWSWLRWSAIDSQRAQRK